MNFNENLVKRNRGRGRKNLRASYNVLNLYKRPEKPSTNLENSDTKWGNSRESVQNVSLSSVRKSTASKNSTEESESRIIVAITEGRGDASCEVGIAAICVSKPLLILCQISDTQSYINTLSKINMFDPNEILVPNTFTNRFSGNRLVDKIKNHFPNIKLVPMPRSSFNKANGNDICSSICLPNMNGILLMLQHRYYALSAVSALVTYVQENFFTYYSPGTVKIEYQESEGYSIIDIATADHLELVCSANPQQNSKHSNLFGIMNYCMTKIGKRTLRSCILQPPCDVSYMEERLDCVSELVDHPDVLASIQAILLKIADIDQLLSIGTIIPSDPQKCTNRQLNYMLVLNNFIELITPLAEILSHLERPFFVNLRRTLERDEFEKIKKVIRENIQESAHPAKGQNGIAQRCFAIKPDVNGLLDLVRKTYTERMNDMREYVKALASKHDLPLTLSNNQTKGYHIVLSLNKHQRKVMTKSELPSEFIQVNRLAGSFTMKTPELMNLSTRLDDIMADILKLSNVMVHTFINEIKQYAHLFYILCEKIALLDVLQSLAETSATNGYVRPQFGLYTEVIEARHPLLDFLLPVRPMPNSIYCSDDYNAHIITGPNGAGKSIFIRQVLLLQVMAQVGCYVPARSAVFRPADRMFARIYFGDYMECSASSFILEMREINYIMSTMTKDSLIIIDELGRSTSLEEGTALAMAIVEKIAQSQAYLYITTHFVLPTRLYDLYPNIKLWQLETVPSGEDPNTFELDFRFQLIPGVTTVTRYGIYMVRNIWSGDVMRHIDGVLARITRKPKDPKTAGLGESCRFKYDIESQCRMLKQRNMLTASRLNDVLETYYEHLRLLGYPVAVENVLVKEPPVPGEAEMELFDADVQVQPAGDVSDDSIRCRTVTDFQELMEPDVQLVEGNTTLDYGGSESPGAYRPSPFTKEERDMLRGRDYERLQASFSVPNISILNTSNVNVEDLESLREDLEVCSKVFSMDDDFGEPEGTTSFDEFGGKDRDVFYGAVASPIKDFGSPQEQYGGFPDATIVFSQTTQRENADFFTAAHSPNGTPTGLFSSPKTGFDVFSPNQIFGTPWRHFGPGLHEFETPQLGDGAFSTCYVPPPSSNGFETKTQFGAFTTTTNEFNALETPQRGSNLFSTNASLDNNYATPRTRFQAQFHTPPRGSEGFSMVTSPPSDLEITRRNFHDFTVEEKLETPERNGDVFSVSSSRSRQSQNPTAVEFKNVETTPKSGYNRFIHLPNPSPAPPKASTGFKRIEAPTRDNNDNKGQSPRKSRNPPHIFPKVIILEGPNDLSISIEERPPSEKINVISNVVVKAAGEETKSPTEKFNDMCTDMSLLRVQSSQCDGESDSDYDGKTSQVSDGEDYSAHSSRRDVSKVESISSNVNAGTSHGTPKTENGTNQDISKDDTLMRSYSSRSNDTTVSANISNNTTLEQSYASEFQSSGTINDDTRPSIHSGGISNVPKYQTKDRSFTSSSGKSNTNKDKPKKDTTSVSDASRLRNLERISSTSSASGERDSKKRSDEQTKATTSTTEASEIRPLSNEENSKNSDKPAKNTTTSISEASKQRDLEKTSTTPTSQKISSSNVKERFNDEQKIDTTSVSEASKLRNLEKVSSRPTPTSNEANKRGELKDDTTSLSEASKQRDLEKTSTTPTSEKISSSNVKERFNDEQKIDTTSVSEASKLRNLEISSRLTSAMNEANKSGELKDDTTSLSEASKQRDLEKSSTTPTSGKISSSVSSASRKRSLDTDSSGTGAVRKNKVLRKSANRPATEGKSSSDDSRKAKRRFVPPRRLTAREIREEFDQQDRKLLETMSEVADMSRYYEQIMNRPSVRQVQNATQLAVIKKTQQGYEVIETAQQVRRTRPRSVQARLSQEVFNLSIFSDRNAKMFEEYAKSDEKNYNAFSFSNATDVGRTNQTMETFLMGVASRLSGNSGTAAASFGMAGNRGTPESFGMVENSGMARSLGAVETFLTPRLTRNSGMVEAFGTAGASGVARHPTSIGYFGRVSGVTENPGTNEAFGIAGASGMSRNHAAASSSARHPSSVEDTGMAVASGSRAHVDEPYTSSAVSSGLFRKEQDRPFQLDANLTPDGYYKRNKEDVNMIMRKYLRNSSGTGGGTSMGNLFEDADVTPDDFSL